MKFNIFKNIFTNTNSKSIVETIKDLEKCNKPATFLLTYKNIRILQIFRVEDIVKWDSVFLDYFSSGIVIAVALNEEIPDYQKIHSRFISSEVYHEFKLISFGGQNSYYLEFDAPIDYNEILSYIEIITYKFYNLPKETELEWKLWISH